MRCFYYEPNDSAYEYCLYTYIRAHDQCSMIEIDNLVKVTEDMLGVASSRNELGGCATIFNTGSSVVYVKWSRHGSSLRMGSIWCERVVGWGVPAPYI
ncbi:hypothetical protein V1508DRAFT_415766 [Lipomyces doorenjongii]|uniref:uncharacterized protein n=1 Tax=Lipomyces doorenjongii TaxID=383834 RepID=UPI0034CF1CC9